MEHIDVESKIVGGFILAANEIAKVDPTTRSWSDVEKARKELEHIKTRTANFLNAIDEMIMEGSEDWKSQWDLANELYAPFNDPYDPSTIDVEVLKAEFVSKGLNEDLAILIASSVKHPVLG